MEKEKELTIIIENLAGGGAERSLVNLMNYLAYNYALYVLFINNYITYFY